MTFCINCGIIRLKLEHQGGDNKLIWYDMSYNRFESDFLNKLETEPEENEVEDAVDEPDQTNSFIFNRYECIL